MKRLKKYFLDMDITDTTYNAIYLGAYGFTKKGEIIYNIPTMNNAAFDPTYWDEDISFTIQRTHKLTPDKPSFLISIPFSRLNISPRLNKTILADYCLRDFGKYVGELNAELYNRFRPDKENGAFYIHKPTAEVVDRNSCFVTWDNEKDYYLNLRIMVQLPLKNHKKAMRMLCGNLPNAVQNFILHFSHEELSKAEKLFATQMHIREWLKNSEYCVFVANGSILPRAKGTELPEANAIPFISPKQDEIEILGIKGMGIRKGVTIITGGGYSGKSTLLHAIGSGVYNHILGDGRELVIADESAMQISAEDGRSVTNVNISTFIKWLPKGETAYFSTTHASGSTSQAANIMEAITFGSKLLLIDEDKSATNFMIQDKVMKMLIKKEPITPFTERVNQIYKETSVSTILVIGGSSEYLSVADNIIMMDEFVAANTTSEAKSICEKNVSTRLDTKEMDWYFPHHIISTHSFTSYPNGLNSEKLEISDMGFIFIGDERIDTRMLHSIITYEQLNAIGFMLRSIELKSSSEQEIDLFEKIEVLFEKIEKEGLETIYSTFFFSHRWLDLPRKYEIMAVINRMRHITFCNTL